MRWGGAKRQCAMPLQICSTCLLAPIAVIEKPMPGARKAKFQHRSFVAEMSGERPFAQRRLKLDGKLGPFPRLTALAVAPAQS
jgi:hypothetical protein